MSSGREEIVISSLHAGNRMQPSRSSSLQVTSALHLISRSIFFLPTCLSASRPELRFILTLWQKGRKDWLQKKNDQIQRVGIPSNHNATIDGHLMFGCLWQLHGTNRGIRSGNQGQKTFLHLYTWYVCINSTCEAPTVHLSSLFYT